VESGFGTATRFPSAFESPGQPQTPAPREPAVPTVRLKLILDGEGVPENAVVVRSSGDPRRDAAAVRVAQGLRFRPVPGQEEGEDGTRIAYAKVEVGDPEAPRVTESSLESR
jgi:TonB family protein